MSTPETERLSQYVSRLTDDTISGKIRWLKSNPTTFLWRTLSPAPGAQLSIQRVTQAKPTMDPILRSLQPQQIIVNYIFQVVSLADQSIMVSINTGQKKNAELTEPMRILFEAIRATIEKEGLDFLGKVIEGKSN